jgi:hypothetical protein
MSNQQVSQAEDRGHLPGERASYRLRIRPWLIYAADRTPLHVRPWFRVSEIADACARIHGSVELDQAKREGTIELLRRAILAGEFDDAKKRSKVANLHPSPAAELRFARDSADIADFAKLDKHLWIRRADCKAWFDRQRIELPAHWFPAVDAAADPQMPGRNVKSSSTTTQWSKAQIKNIVSQYRRSLSTDSHPSNEALVSFAQESGLRGHRDDLRKEYRSQFPEQQVGRPRKR